jgi:rubrerythrin
MDEMVVCYYCGSLLEPEDKNCPLCGATRQE